MVPLEWAGDTLRLLDQTKLPEEQAVVVARSYNDVIHAIRTMQVRGAPAIGVAGAYGLVLAAKAIDISNLRQLCAYVSGVGEQVATARPTAVNLRWAVDRMLNVVSSCSSVVELRRSLEEEAIRIHREDIEANKRMGALGAEFLPTQGAVLTHCNAGALATGGYGTALGVIRSAWEQGKKFKVMVTETRPLLQGARLTAWELVQLGIPVDLLVDSAAGSMLAKGEVSCVIVGADRIAANGDTANKIGTYSIAVLAHENNVPFYVAAPTNTVDLSVYSGKEIPIEERDQEEVLFWNEKPVTPKGINVRNPAFDVTPNQYISAIITECGIARPPFEKTLRQLVEGERGDHHFIAPAEELRGATGD
ncbi:S-methyl-5-thioribose-1-phosphate isomerase [Dehalococcoidia bacterium]|nr:S-methyl-5-thioribose-1-phosphate isomerase [Dehalococcoidia bacterium]